eukprot:UN30299
MAKALMAAGLQQHDSINIIGFNSFQWITANLGCIVAGGVAAGQYTNNNPGQCEYIATNCDARFIFVENAKQLDKWVDISQKMSGIKGLICWDESSPLDPKYSS